ncbi:FAD-dependent oxidoreductase [Aquincola tertiaricarbonis]|uniref:FAD-dependent oxidoreductase n=1 Tax=Aquincola tertiaricarbonis TaxID=391953 RepID=UPI000614E7DF|nr:FAD-dependent oxidoreductase [Aquincola tertiaricarbonis]
MSRVGIAGAGLLGRLLAWRLAAAGHEVQVFDPAASPDDRTPPQAAGWTAAGMLSPIAELETADLRTAQRGWRSLDLWARWLPQLSRQVHFRREGSLLLAHRGDAGSAQRLLAVLQAKAAGRADQPQPRPLSAAELAALEPAVHGPALAWLLPGEGQLHCVQAMQALAHEATGQGVRWHWRMPVQQVDAGRLDGQAFDHVFDVRGLGARPQLPVRGVRGELLWVQARGLVLHRPLRLLHPRWRVYLVPRPDDIVLVGATEVESEDRSPISVRSLLGLLSAAHSVLPELAEGRVLHMETNLRPALPDNLPQLQVASGLTRINGLFRHGWLLAPALVEEALAASGLREAA